MLANFESWAFFLVMPMRIWIFPPKFKTIDLHHTSQLGSSWKIFFPHNLQQCTLAQNWVHSPPIFNWPIRRKQQPQSQQVWKFCMGVISLQYMKHLILLINGLNKQISREITPQKYNSFYAVNDVWCWSNIVNRSGKIQNLIGWCKQGLGTFSGRAQQILSKRMRKQK